MGLIFINDAELYSLLVSVSLESVTPFLACQRTNHKVRSSVLPSQDLYSQTVEPPSNQTAKTEMRKLPYILHSTIGKQFNKALLILLHYYSLSPGLH